VVIADRELVDSKSLAAGGSLRRMRRQGGGGGRVRRRWDLDVNFLWLSGFRSLTMRGERSRITAVKLSAPVKHAEEVNRWIS
jgi:hypothetical protein